MCNRDLVDKDENGGSCCLLKVTDLIYSRGNQIAAEQGRN